MRLSTLVFLVLIAAAMATVGWVLRRATQDQRDWQELISRSGQDLQSLPAPEQGRIHRIIRKLLPRGEAATYRPRWTLSLSRGDQSRLLVFLQRPELRFGRLSEVRVYAFDEARRLRSIGPLWMGDAYLPTAVRSGSRPDLSSWGFDLETTEAWDWLECRRHYYFMEDDQPVLARLEAADGTPTRNNYEEWEATVGPPPPTRTPEEWEQALASSSATDVLGALVWLGGIHTPPMITSTLLPWMDHEDAALFHATRARPGVARRLAELAQSPERWIAEAASSALK